MNRGTIHSGKARLPLVKREGEVRPGQHHRIDAGFFHEVFPCREKDLTLGLRDGSRARHSDLGFIYGGKFVWRRCDDFNELDPLGAEVAPHLFDTDRW